MTSVEQVINAPALVDARHRVEMIRGHVEDIKVLVVDAYRARDWDVLGYATWADYCREEFGGTIAIPREERGDVVFTLRDAGLSTRAIGAAVQVSEATVRNDLAGAQKVRTSSGPPAPSPTDPDDEVVDAELVDEPIKVTGTDGKRYNANQPAPRSVKDRRRPWPDAFRDIVHKADSIAVTLQNLADDDRAAKHADQMGTARLLGTIEKLTAAAEQIRSMTPGAAGGTSEGVAIPRDGRDGGAEPAVRPLEEATP